MIITSNLIFARTFCILSSFITAYRMNPRPVNYYGGAGYWVALILVSVISALVQANMNSVMRAYLQKPAKSGVFAQNLVQRMLEENNVYDVQIRSINGFLTDNFHPSKKVISLSEPVYNSYSIAAIAIAAHETGHALQEADNYIPNRIRYALVPLVNIGSRLAPIAIIAGLFISPKLLLLGLIIFGLSLLISLVTLPVEFNASHRALKYLKSSNVLDANELPAAKKVLKAAAMTYVVASLASLVQFLRFFAIFRNSNRDNR